MTATGTHHGVSELGKRAPMLSSAGAGGLARAHPSVPLVIDRWKGYSVLSRLLAPLLLLMLVLATSAANADSPGLAINGIGRVPLPPGPLGARAHSRTQPPDSPVTHDVVGVPLWQSTFNYGGQLWGAAMVGTDPANGSTTTVVPVTIVPLRVTFASDGLVQEYSGMAEELAASALFQPFPWVTGYTQYVDAFRRGDFWPAVTTTSPDYHLLLGAPRIAAVQQLTVPASKGLTVYTPAANRRLGIVEGTWFYNQIKQMVASLQIDPRSLVVFLGYNLEFTYDATTPDACFTTGCLRYAGVHGALDNGPQLRSPQVPRSVNTYVYASFEDPGDLVPPSINFHLAAVSHELLEWANDPIALNAYPNAKFGYTYFASGVPSWSSPYWGGGCSIAYEVADPLDSTGIAVPNGSHYDVFAAAVFQSWFARQSPSTAVLGLYDTGGYFSTYAAACP